MEKVGVVCFLASYAVAFILELLQLKWRNRPLRTGMLGMLAAGLVAQTIYLYFRSVATQLPPLMSSAHDWLLILSWLVVLVFLLVTLFDWKSAAGLIVLPLVIVLVAASLFVSLEADPWLSGHKGFTMLHVSLLVFGVGGMLIGLVSGLMYLWQHYRLKHRQSLQAGMELPSLERLEHLNRLAILISVPLLSIGMILGVGLIILKGEPALASRVLQDPIIIGSMIGWLLMTGVFFWLLASRGEPGRRIAWLTVWSCGFLISTTVGTQVLTRVLQTQTIHGAPQQESP